MQTDPTGGEFPWGVKTPLELLGTQFQRSERCLDAVSYIDTAGRRCEFKYLQFAPGGGVGGGGEDGSGGSGSGGAGGRVCDRLCFFIDGEAILHGVTKIAPRRSVAVAEADVEDGKGLGEEKPLASAAGGEVVIAIDGTCLAGPSVKEWSLDAKQTVLPALQPPSRDSTTPNPNEGRTASVLAEEIVRLPKRGRKLNTVAEEINLDRKIVCLYFGAPRWCGPCRGFSQPPKDRAVAAHELRVEQSELQRIYEMIKGADEIVDPFEFVYCCLDDDVHSFEGFATEMPGLVSKKATVKSC